MAEARAPAPPVPENVGPLSPELAAHEVELLENAIRVTVRRRRVMLAGYCLALLALIGGILFALSVYGQTDGGRFTWVFFVPPALSGSILWTVNWVVRRIR